MEGPDKRVVYGFGNFRLDVAQRKLFRGAEFQLLTPRLFQILLVLLENAGEVVTKERLIERVWNQTFVEEGNLSRNISTLRKCLDENPANPQYIDTIARVGYRFIAPVQIKTTSRRPAPPRPAETVGRQNDHLVLKTAFEKVQAGVGSILAVTGEAGIGKTTFVLESLARLSDQRYAFHTARGRSSERLAGAEAFLPFLEALQDLIRGADGAFMKETLRLVAPHWHGYLYPSPQSVTMPESQAELVPDPKELFKLELSNFLRAVTARAPLVLFLDDVHWIDLSTVELLSYIVDKMSSLRLLVVLAYRPSEMHLANHPFTGIHLDWKGRGVYQELGLQFLDTADVQTLLDWRYPRHRFPQTFAGFVQSRTSGNPLFICDLLRYMQHRELIRKSDAQWELGDESWDLAGELPESIRAMIERKIGQLTDLEHRIMVAASVQGEEFDSAVVARALDLEDVTTEETLANLDRVHSLVRLFREGETHDGTPMLRYRFVHVLYQNALAASLPPARRGLLHRSVARALLQCEGPKAGNLSAHLAVLFETARDFALAGEYFLAAAGNAHAIFASDECLRLARRGLDAIRKLPESAKRAALELHSLVTIGRALLDVKSYGAGEIERVYAEARELCARAGPTAHIYPALYGLCIYYFSRSEVRTALQISHQFIRISEEGQDRVACAEAHLMHAGILALKGQLGTAEHHLGKVLEHYHPDDDRTHAALYVLNPRAAALSYYGITRTIQGFADKGLADAEQAVTGSRELKHPGTFAFALMELVYVHFLRGQPVMAVGPVQQLEQVVRDHRLFHNLVVLDMYRGWIAVEEGRFDPGLHLMQTAFAALRAANIRMTLFTTAPMLCEGLKRARRGAEALVCIEELLTIPVEDTYACSHAELWRLKGELAASPAKAETCLQKALEIARQQNAKLYELKAATSLSALYKRQGRGRQARGLLEPVLSWFSEGAETRAVKQAQALVRSLTASSGASR